MILSVDQESLEFFSFVDLQVYLLSQKYAYLQSIHNHSKQLGNNRLFAENSCRIMDQTKLFCHKVAHVISGTRKHFSSQVFFLIAFICLSYQRLEHSVLENAVMLELVILDEKILVNGTMSKTHTKFLSQIFANCLSVPFNFFSFIFYTHRCL